MPSLLILIVLLTTASFGQAHYVFVRLAHNGVWQPPLGFIRNTTSPFQEPPGSNFDGYRDWSYPTFPSDSPNSVRFGRDNLAWAPATGVLKVKAGDTVEFIATQLRPNTWDLPGYVQWDNCPDGRGACSQNYSDYFHIFHRGPVIMHLSRVPPGEEVHVYDGSGEWVKIYTVGLELRKDPQDPIFWLPQNGGQLPPRLIAKLPKQTPAGQYLLRVDQVWYGSGNADPQMYPSCAQIEVSNDISGELSSGIKIPEGMSRSSPGMMYTNDDWPLGANGYTYPGGPLWDGEKSV